MTVYRKHPLKSMALVILTTVLSACSTTSRLDEPPAVIKVDTPERRPPANFLEKCPSDLPQTGIPEDVWNELTGEQQLRIIVHLAADWGKTYHICAERQRALVDWATGEK